MIPIDSILAAIITGGLALIGVIITNNRGNSKMQADMKLEFAKAQAVTDTKIEELTREVREHNNFARRVPLLEEKVNRNEKDIAELSKYHKEPI